MKPVIEVTNLSKQYRLGETGTGSLRHDVNRAWHRLRGLEDPYMKLGETNDRARKGGSEYVWALRNIDFSVAHGEVLGIIGKNGAGKSTLLKILSRTTSPTAGKIKMRGRIASLLEVGTGFHPELTGRENIFLNGAILGMTRRETKSKFDEIVDFAGVERYIDTPVKRYSSGMYVRLAFAVAAHLEPDILIVDEVLAVGDAEFQKKALGKMKAASVQEGRTVLFVSHDLPNVRRLTNITMLMDCGAIKNIGPTLSIISDYLRINSSDDFAYANTDTSTFCIASITVKTSLANNLHEFSKPLSISFTVFLKEKLPSTLFSFQIFNANTLPVLNILYDGRALIGVQGYKTIVCTFDRPRLFKGTYTISAYLGDDRSKRHLESVQYVCPFEITELETSSDIKLDNVCSYVEDFEWT